MIRKQRTKLLLKLLLGITIVSLFLWLNLVYKIYRQSIVNEVQKADAIIVLGASQWDGKPSPVFKDRLDHALSLYEKNSSDSFILTGGFGEDDNMSESQAGKSYLMQKGITEENIFIEEKSKTTWQNLNEAVKIINQQDFNSIILVSDGFHMFRLKKMANDLGIKNYIYPVQNGIIEKDKITNFKYVVRESIVYILYRLFKM